MIVVAALQKNILVLGTRPRAVSLGTQDEAQKGLTMNIDIFLGGLASLVLVAIIIVTLTSNGRRQVSERSNGTSQRSNSDRASKSDR
ncbi:hypothetical protein AB2B41_00215 [Marimonas sp. MJW-29]|uniref:Uncharacterized protein n=2 Tax=Sulfitobacter sediminis TaxID=3234186 RepID=A0ABV3RGB6_9RHOB